MFIVSKTKIKKGFILPVVAGITFLITIFFNKNRSIAEHFYSQKIYPHIANVLSKFSSVFAFSVDDLFYGILIGIFIAMLISLLIGKLKIRRFFSLVLTILSVVYILFYLFWGFNYFRQDVNSRTGLKNHPINNSDFETAFLTIIRNTNSSYSSFENFDPQKIDSLVELSYKNSARALNIKYPQGKRKAKPISLSSFFAKGGISGYYGPFFSEVHINQNVLPIEYPFVLAHEKAHQFGITSEAEANFYAWITCTQSNSKLLKYSANISILRHFIIQGFSSPNYKELVSLINKPVKNDFNTIQKHWNDLRNERVDKITTKANDTYLKTNKIENGINNYNDVVQLVSDFVFDTDFQKRHNLLPQ